MKNKTTATIIRTSLAGSAGGVAFAINNPQESIGVACYSGAIAGIMGAALLAGKLAKWLNKEVDPTIEITMALVAGITFKQIFTAIAIAATSHFRLQQLQTATAIERVETIEQIEQITNTPDRSARKAIGLSALHDIAENSSDLRIQKKAIAASDSTAQFATPELKLKHIEELQELFQATEDPNIKERILDDLLEFANGSYSAQVKSKADEALEKVSSK